MAPSLLSSAPSIGSCPNCKLLLQHFLLHSQTALAASCSLFCNSATWCHLWRHLWVAAQTANCLYNTSASPAHLFWLLEQVTYSLNLQLGAICGAIYRLLSQLQNVSTTFCNYKLCLQHFCFILKPLWLLAAAFNL